MINHPYRIYSTPTSPRPGTTLVEVLFSIGVVLIGLVGLVAVIPVAGRRAEDSVALNTGSALAASASNNLISRGYADRSTWVWRNDAGTSILVPSGAGTAYCLDPLFLPTPPVPTDQTGYRRTLFPFYRTTYNPLVDPSLPVNDPWPAQPRMWRVSIDRAGQGGAQFLTSKEAELIVESGDGLSQANPKDNTLASVAIGHSAHPSDGGYGKRTTSGKYTWFATFNQIPETASAEVSTVIVRSRDRSFYTPQNGDGPAATDEDNASSERLAYVESAAGFSGGAGGTVTIVASDKTKSKITSNEWVMLSRRVSSEVDVHQWYRVTGAIGDAEKTQVTDPVTSGTRNVWRRQLMLDGPDWDFSALVTTPGDVSDDTIMTIVEDVVSVSRRSIPFTP